MKLKSELQLRKIGSRYMIVDTCSAQVNLTNVFSLNETAAWLWKKIGEKDFTPELLTDWLCEEYEVEKATAEADVKKLLEEWVNQGLATE